MAADVLAQKPDLLFVEFRVNGSAGFDMPTVEGIVRQARRANPELDICFVYTVSEWMHEGLKTGRRLTFNGFQGIGRITGSVHMRAFASVRTADNLWRIA